MPKWNEENHIFGSFGDGVFKPGGKSNGYIYVPADYETIQKLNFLSNFDVSLKFKEGNLEIK
ncbi:MAG: hypothetical protein AB1414_14810 [bacterium]